MTAENCKDQLLERIQSMNYAGILDDVRPFVEQGFNLKLLTLDNLGKVLKGKILDENHNFPDQPDAKSPAGTDICFQLDVHTGNLFVDEEYALTLFDFDDCIYGHFIYDIAMVLFYIAGWGGADVPGFTERFMPVFLQGYREFNRLDPSWLAQIPHFLKLREIDLFAAFLYTMGENPQEDPWCAHYMQGRRQKIVDDVPFIEFDWESLAEYL